MRCLYLVLGVFIPRFTAYSRCFGQTKVRPNTTLQAVTHITKVAGLHTPLQFSPPLFVSDSIHMLFEPQCLLVISYQIRSLSRYVALKTGNSIGSLRKKVLFQSSSTYKA